MAMIVQQVREMSGLSMRKMAAKLGISATYINDIEKGREPLRDNVRRALYEVFDLDADKVAELERDYRKYREEQSS